MKITDQEALDAIFNTRNHSGTIKHIRSLIMSIYNYRAYEAPALFTMLRNADFKHKELILSIITIIASFDNDEAFYIERHVAPKLIELGLDSQFLSPKD